ncbi:hypothetical protein DM455_12005 [Legionella pneumophila]|uniref:hypothetical protein n=1 Tax=Legionella pneumophila TaxID=446 RepID=UPI000D7C988A|nr:hypothetical protein [Legionella pneumophila]PYB43281.1 hypothetical protein DM454_12055 [Legionella pneumophila]PYB48983.1 hypothetical protein DM456_12735 [Legionella pneumophila]PYB62072.1 hypothetical protein DM455_12005 [Legionella pneumophila]TID58037.1 hypothetical protein DIZ40_13160 [Legionella pneumophila]TID58785.1 hypothetical protein DIZ38_11855 [Legionella pneumophila]
MINYIELAKQAAEKYGFILEFNTKKELEKNQYQVDLNVPLPGGIEVDVKASKYKHMQLIIECKGADPTSCLILVKEAKKEHYNSRRHIIAHTNFAIAQYKPHPDSEFFTFTGDFFHLSKDKKQLNKAPGDYDKNNFYKAQTQIIEAINAISSQIASKNKLKLLLAISDSDLSEENKLNATINMDEIDPGEKKDWCYLIPVIVTNVNNIFVIDYNQNEVIVESHKWVLQKTKINEQISLRKKNGEKPYSISIAVVGIKYLDEFTKYVEGMVVSDGEIKLGSSNINDIFNAGVIKLGQYIKNTYGLDVNNHQIINGELNIRFLNTSNILVLDITKYRDVISFFPNNPTNKEDKKYRDELITEVDTKLKNQS